MRDEYIEVQSHDRQRFIMFNVVPVVLVIPEGRLLALDLERPQDPPDRG